MGHESFLKHLHDTNDICLFSYQIKDFNPMALYLKRDASSVELMINTNITKVLSHTGH